MRKAKLSLIASVAVGLLAVTTAGVSTYAWFKTTSSSFIVNDDGVMDITVNKPDDYTFYSYKGNTETSWSSPGTFDNDFFTVSSVNLSTYTSFSNFVPGDNYIYAIKIEQTTSLSVAITKIISNNASKQGLSYSRTTWSGYSVNVGWAIDIFEYDEVTNHGSLPTGYSTIVSQLVSDASYPDRFNFSESTNRTVLEAAGSGSSPNKVITLGSSVGIYNNSVASLNYNQTTSALNSSKDIYVFFSIVYSDDDSTYYKEVKSGSDSTEIFVSPTDANRYFKKDTGGNSNCYAGLKFALSEISINIG